MSTWTTPRTWVAAELVTAAIGNVHWRDNLASLREGQIAIASQATGDFVFASSATQLGRLAVGGAYQSIRRNSAAAAYEFYKYWHPRTAITASTGTPTPSADTDDGYVINALAANATFGAPTGTPGNHQRLLIQIKDNGTSRTLAWNAIYVAAGPALPTATTISKWLTLLFVYNTSITSWQLIATAQEA